MYLRVCKVTREDEKIKSLLHQITLEECRLPKQMLARNHHADRAGPINTRSSCNRINAGVVSFKILRHKSLRRNRSHPCHVQKISLGLKIIPGTNFPSFSFIFMFPFSRSPIMDLCIQCIRRDREIVVRETFRFCWYLTLLLMGLNA